MIFKNKQKTNLEYGKYETDGIKIIRKLNVN